MTHREPYFLIDPRGRLRWWWPDSNDEVNWAWNWIEGPVGFERIRAVGPGSQLLLEALGRLYEVRWMLPDLDGTITLTHLGPAPAWRP